MNPVQLTCTEGPLVVGGPGTYLIEGATGSGKSRLLCKILSISASKFKLSNIVTYSGTSESTSSLDFVADIFPYLVGRWAKALNVDEVAWILKHRSKFMESMKEKGMDQDEWVKDNPMLIIVDDVGGITNSSSFIKSPWYHIVTTARHLNVYMIFLAQYASQLGPAMINNCRCIMSFDSSDKALKKFSECGFNLSRTEISSLQDELRKPYHYLAWWQSWQLNQPRPRYPWIGKPVDESKRQLQFIDLDNE